MLKGHVTSAAPAILQPHHFPLPTPLTVPPPHFLTQGLGRWEESQMVTSVDGGEDGGRAQIWRVAFTQGVNSEMWGGCVFSLERGR